MRQNSVVATRSLVWEEMPVRPDLVSGEVHLLSAFTAEDRIPREADWALLTEPEKRRARRFKFDYHRNRWVAGRCGLKRILGIYVGCSSAEIRLRYGDIGKPYLDNRGSKSLMFNYTDSGGYLIYAIGLEQELGIDLEHLPRATNYAGLARKKLSEREKCAFDALEESACCDAFLAHWTRKEAYGKALGVGIRYSMKDVTLCEDYANSEYQRHDDEHGTIHLSQIQPPFSGISTLAVVGAAVRLRAFQLPQVLESSPN